MFKRAKRGARGKAQENMVMNPNWITISRYSVMIIDGQVGARKKSWRYGPIRVAHSGHVIRC